MEEREELCAQLDTVNTALDFLAVIVISVLLSLWAVLRQRRALCLTIQGEDEAAREVGETGPIRAVAGALVLGALGYFFWLAAEAWLDAGDGDERDSARADLWASALVLSAAIIRWRELTKR